ncbi:GPI transamidase subunit PIG-U [Lipomyces japonicus]|uniref:GPI transamidase subunit PIG-U n=1 Tax=Lipomyces japonicus TaxID=56871 RepID=UPI0034D003D1
MPSIDNASQVSNYGKTKLVILASVVLRLGVVELFPALPALLQHRPEITTTATSFKQLKEGLYLYRAGQDAYDGGVFHQSPLLLVLFNYIGRISLIFSPELFIGLFFACLDVVTARSFCSIARSPRLADKQRLPQWAIAAIYLLNPIIILTNIARSTALISNAAVVLAIAHTCNENFLFSALFLALGVQLNFYVVYIIPPLILLWHSTPSAGNPKGLVLKNTLTFCAFSALFIGAGILITGSCGYLSATTGFTLKFEDLLPNMGLWWYFFLEMFDFFRPFFTHIFQLYSLIYVFPITIRLQKQPLFAITTIVGITAISKSYPEIGDLGLYISFLSLFKFIFPNVQYAFFAGLVILHSFVLAPNFYHLWIYLGSGNANFFYAITLVYTIGLTIIITDTLRASLQLEFDGGKNPEKSVVQI